MGAGSRFDEPLTLISDGRQVVACGPLGFFGNETHAEVAITLRQPGHGIVNANGVFANPAFNGKRTQKVVSSRGKNEDDEWMLTGDVRPDMVSVSILSAQWTSFSFTPTQPWDPNSTAPLVKSFGVIRYHTVAAGVDVHVWHGDSAGNDLQVRWV
jgi:hypothetical protein